MLTFTKFAVYIPTTIVSKILNFAYLVNYVTLTVFVITYRIKITAIGKWQYISLKSKYTENSTIASAYKNLVTVNIT